MTVKIAILKQRGKRIADNVVFEEYTLEAELAADGFPSVKVSATIPEKKL